MFILIDVPMQIIRSLVLIICCDAVVSALEGQLWSKTIMKKFYFQYFIADYFTTLNKKRPCILLEIYSYFGL